jgi:uncharacterized membrane protein
MSDVLREVVLIAATMTMGLMAGVFGIYGNAIMPGPRWTDDRTFVAAFQSIDRAIINPAFMATFFGALALTGLAALLHLTGDGRPMLAWIAAALVLYLFVFVITIGVNVPRNSEIDQDGSAWCAGAIRRGQVGPVEPRADVRLYRRVRPARLGARRVWTDALTRSEPPLGRRARLLEIRPVPSAE